MDFGTSLRSAREQRGVALGQIALTTKISVGTLEALERNDPSRLPGGIFSRSFVRGYALEVGLDPERTVTEFVAAFPDHGPSPAVEVSQPAKADDGRSAMGLAAVVMLALAVLGGFYAWPWRQRPQTAAPFAVAGPAPARAVVASVPAAPATPESRIATSPASTPAVEGGASSEAPSASEVGPSVTPEPSPAAAASQTSAGLRVTVHPREACWVRITVEGQVRVSRLMQAGDREEFATDGPVFLEVGNAAVFDYTVNGARGRALGAIGQVVRATIRHDNLDTFVAR